MIKITNFFIYASLISAWILEYIYRNDATISGAVHVTVENFLYAVLILNLLTLRKHREIRFLILYSLFYLVGCLIYGYFIYISHKTCSGVSCISFGIPFNLGSMFLFFFLRELMRSSREKHILKVSNIMSIVVFVLYTHIFLIPELIQKDYHLLIKITGVMYSLITCWNIGYSLAGLLVYFSKSIQVIFFAIVIAFLADVALRTENINPTFLGVQIFGNIFVIHIAFILIAFTQIKSKSLRLSQSLDSLWREERNKNLPLFSLRALSLCMLSILLLLQWSYHNFDYLIHPSAAKLASSSLQVMFILGVSLILISAFTRSISRIVQVLERCDDSVVEEVAQRSTFYEISLLLKQLSEHIRVLRNNRDHHARINAFFAHQIPQAESVFRRIKNKIQPFEEFKEELKDLEALESFLAETPKEVMANVKSDLDARPLSDVLTMVADQIRRMNPESRINLDILELKTNVRIVGFSGHLRNIIQNGIDSACGYTVPEVFILAFESDHHIQVVVRDNGRGMSSELLQLIREKQQVSLKTGGNGIGLSSALNWAESKGIKCKISSELKMGTTVVFSIKKVNE